ncbi:hypothetical protein [Streptomyces cyaneofuscatus]|uniref:hypothetical protein n=1 Tax=Streptomyces cyaneofuscatus TaxID=66883 RepID=UPI002E0E1452|nr:hypothetical protein OG366_00400 [Streptomyces cyaneofuscatus]WSI52672.1 hypothetical protein OG366_36765 [Streptomyces cyaneofuscatus]
MPTPETAEPDTKPTVATIAGLAPATQPPPAHETTPAGDQPQLAPEPPARLPDTDTRPHPAALEDSAQTTSPARAIPGRETLTNNTPAPHPTPRGQGADVGASTVQNVRHNYGVAVAVQNVNEIQRLRGTPLPDDWIKDHLRAYLPDDQTDKTLDTLLHTHRVAVLHNTPGTGRYTTALHTFSRLHVKDIRQVRREPNDPVELEGLQDEDTGWILDLRAEGEPLRRGFGLHLREAAEHLRAMRSYVIVVTQTDAWNTVANEAAELAHLLAPPSALEALRTHLQRHQPPLRDLDKWCAHQPIAQHLDRAAPAEAARLARIITTAVGLDDSTHKPKSFEELAEAVIESSGNWREVLRTWHTENPNSAHRNYLLAAAVLDGAPAEAVYEAQTTLGEALNDTPPPTRGQQGPGIIELTHTIGAEYGDDDRIHFIKPGYAEAVVEYFWADRPHHIASFTRWTAEQAAALPADLGVPLAERVAQWATRYTAAKQSFTVLRAIATHWAKTRNLPGQATDLLVAAALHPTVGNRARAQYLAWAKAPDTKELTLRGSTPTVLKQTLAGALAQLGHAYPQIALKRLAELAAHTTDQAVTDAVGDALADLWDQPAHQDTIRTTLTTWFAAPQHHYTAAARRTFLHLAARTTDGIPLLLPETDNEADPLALTGWRSALDQEADTHLQHAVNAWLDSALAHHRLRPGTLRTFTEALFRSGTDRTYLAPRFLTLNHAAYAWEPACPGGQPTPRTRLRDDLIHTLREADPTAPRHAPTQ